MNKTNAFPAIRLFCVLLFILAFTSAPAKAAGTCALTAGQVLINEILPAPASGNPEWVELFNTTASDLDLSYCYIDDIAGGGGSPVQIAAGTTIPAHGFWVTPDMSSYFNNTGDDVRLLIDDATTVLDSHTYGTTSADYSWYRNPDGGDWSATATSSSTKGFTNIDTCGDGTWVPNTLEIHHIDVGQADATLIVSPTGKSLLFDVGNASAGDYAKNVLGCAQLDYVAISHFHEDHIGTVGSGGLWNLVEVQGFQIGKTLLRNYNQYVGGTNIDNWKTYIEGSGQAKLHPETAVEGASQIDLGGGVVVDLLTVDGNGAIKPGNFYGQSNAPSENDYSLGIRISYGDFDEWLAGDLDGELNGGYHDIELSVAREVGDVEVYRVHHHGSTHSSSATFVDQLDPEVSIISVGDNNTFSHPTTEVMEYLNNTSTVYRTERGQPAVDVPAVIVGGNIVVRTLDGLTYTVNYTLNTVPTTDTYTATEPVRTDADGDGYFFGVDPNDNDNTIIPMPNGGCDPVYQVCTCSAAASQVVINEVLPAPSTGNNEWVELFNQTALPINLGFCNLDDAEGGKSPWQIPANTIIPPNGFYLSPGLSAYFNNTGDDVRFLGGDPSIILDSYTFGATDYDVSWHRTPDGGSWAAAPTTLPTPGEPNNPIKKLTARSQRAYDGWILETAEKSNRGGTMNTVAKTLSLGDDKARKQYRSILSFPTASLPDNAVITKATLMLKYQSAAPAGTDPIALLQGLYVDVRKGYFGLSPALELVDFQFAANKSAGPFKPALSTGWYTVGLPKTTFAYLNKLTTFSGLTQLRLRFKLDDNNNALANMLNLVSGNISAAASRPALIIEYYVP